MRANQLTEAPPLRTQLLRTVANLTVLAGLLLIPWELSAQQAGLVSVIGLALLILTLTSAGVWLIEKVLALPVNNEALNAPGRGMLLLVGLVRRAGLSSLGLVFFLVWALIYMGVWALDPGTAFSSGQETRAIADFFYLAVNLSVANPPPDLYPVSTLARAASSIEVISALALVTMFAGTFFGISKK